jgi:hypothetical protein
MARVYSTRFIAAALIETENANYVVPDGFAAVLRCLTATQIDTGAGGVVEWDLFIGGTDGVRIIAQSTTGANTTALNELRVILNAGDALLVQNDNEPTQHVTASGYLLSLP